MTAYTPGFGIPYQSLTGAFVLDPEGLVGEDGALSVDTALTGLGSRIGTLETLGAWSSYGSISTVLTATTTNPTLGNSVFLFESAKINNKIMAVRYKLTIGSTFTAGSGSYRFLLPAAASANALSSGSAGSARLTDAGVALYVGVSLLADSTHFGITQHGQGNDLGSGGPGTAWAATDAIQGSFIYELA